ncbi:MAG TPA: TetR/AcrR family transcriptional regulator [Chloroflexota bacterium]|jgi:TetR/AcrR family transcriptional repressor of nem operon
MLDERDATESDNGSARQRLIDSAVRLIHAGSYHSVSVHDVCADAGVNKGSFYYYFASKRDLALATIEVQWEHHRTGLYEKAFAPDIPPLDRIIRFFDMLPDWTMTLAVGGDLLGCPFGNLGVEMATEDHGIRDKVREVLVDRLACYFAIAIQEASEAGDIEPVDAQAAAVRLVAYVEGVYLMAKVEDDPELFARLGRAALGLIPG